MDGKIEITPEQLYEYTVSMDILCDANDFNGITELCEELNKHTHKSAFYRLRIYYTIGTGYSHVSGSRDKCFESKTSGLALLNFRKALAEVKSFARGSLGIIQPDDVMEAFYDLRSRLLTNLANELNHQGRRLEALTYYEGPTASGNVHALLGKASCIHGLAEGVYDGSDAHYLYRESAKLYREVFCRINEFPPSQKRVIKADPFYKRFIRKFEAIESKVGDCFPDLSSLKGRPVKSKQEKDYFAWCAENRLFINCLNGISVSDVVNQDVLTLPNFSTRINTLLTAAEELSFHGHFDEMKTDYCYARYLAFMGSTMPIFGDHFFNSTFEHVDTLDYANNNLKMNHLKSCFRISYSIFDKISFFLHRFFELDEVNNDHMVDFKKVWFKPGSKKLKDIFQSSNNEYFRALHFISHEIRQGGRNTPDEQDLSYWFDPATQRLFKIRNAMEHRSLKLVDGIGLRDHRRSQEDVDCSVAELAEKRAELNGLKENLEPTADHEQQIKTLEFRISNIEKDLDEKTRMSSYSLVIGFEEFESLTMKLLTLAKDGLIYLSLAIRHEESNRPTSELTIPYMVPKK